SACRQCYMCIKDKVKFNQKNYEDYILLDRKKLEKILKTIEFYHLKNGISSDFQIDLICIKNDVIQFCENISF
ncbi:hypothetical protein ACISOH_08390, partial [Campylobacter jejuni]